MMSKGREHGFWGKKNETKIEYLAHVKVTGPNKVLNIGYFFPQYLVPFLFAPPLPPIPISHQLSH